MRDRLIELLKQADEYASGVCIDYDEAQEVCADHLIAAGVIVPPCKVGDTVYILCGEPSQTIAEFRVRTILFGETHDSIGFANRSVFTVWEKRWNDFFGKTVFLTREEAERALAKRREQE